MKAGFQRWWGMTMSRLGSEVRHSGQTRWVPTSREPGKLLPVHASGFPSVT